MGFDLLDWYRGKMTLRRLMVLVSQLPADGNVCRREGLGWVTSDYQSANVLDRINRVAYLLEVQIWANSDGKSQAPTPPDPVWRPNTPALPAAETQPDQQDPGTIEWSKKEDVSFLLKSTSIRKRYAKEK